MSNKRKIPAWAQFAVAAIVGGGAVIGIGLTVIGSDDSSSSDTETSSPVDSYDDETSNEAEAAEEPSEQTDSTDEDETSQDADVSDGADDAAGQTDSTDEDETSQDADVSDGADDAAGQTDEAPDTEAAPEPTPDQDPAPTDDEPAEDPADATAQVATLLASLDGGSFRLEGVVPDEETASRLSLAAVTAYGFTADIDLEVSPGIGAPAWLATAHNGITLIPMITDGFIEAAGDTISVGGTSPNPNYLAAFETAVGNAFVTSEVASDVAITDLAAPSFHARRTDGIVTLTGSLPADEIRDIIVDGAIVTYGADAVDDQTTIGDGLYTSFWMYTMPDVFLFFEAFPDYEIDVTDGITTGSVNDGINFETGSDVLSPEVESVLNIAAALLVRDQTLGISMTGHTDSVGDEDSNQRLSERRANAAVAFLLQSGIDGSRLKSEGLGDSAPIAANDTDEGRAKNRRIEFDFGPVS